VELCSTPENSKWGRRSPHYMKTVDLGDTELWTQSVDCNTIIKDHMIQTENFILTSFIAYSPCHKLKFNENEVDNTFWNTTHKTHSHKQINKQTCKCGHDASNVGSSSSGSKSGFSLGGNVRNRFAEICHKI
jgi:hypothetical protein